MPTDQSGNYSLPQIYLAQPGTTILAEQHNQPLQDIAQAMSQRLMRDGRNGMVGNLDLGSFRVINVGDGINESDAVNVGQAGDVVAASTEGAPVKNTPVDADSLPLSDSENDNTLKKLTWARVKAVLATVLVPQTRTVTGGGLATGGGALTENRTITVAAASQSQAIAGTSNEVAMTPQSHRQALAGISANAIGSYCLLRVTTNGSFGPGDTVSGGNLQYSNARGNSLGSPPGSWICCGTCNGGLDDDRSTTLFRRVS